MSPRDTKYKFKLSSKGHKPMQNTKRDRTNQKEMQNDNSNTQNDTKTPQTDTNMYKETQVL